MNNATLSLFGTLAVWKWTAVIIAVSLMPTVSRTTTYYVSPSGSDSNPGTESQPWRTLQHAADTVSAGDTVLVQAGTYNEWPTTKRGGIEGNYITFKSNAGTNAVIGGFRVNHPYVRVEGFKVTGYGANVPYGLLAAEQPPGITCQGAWAQFVGNWFFSDFTKAYCIGTGGSASNVLIHGNHFINPPGYGLVLNGSHPMDRGHVVSSNWFESGETEYDAIRVFSADTVITGNTFTNWSRKAGSAAHCDIIQTFAYSWDSVKGCSNVVFENNWVVNCAGTQMGHLEDQTRQGAVRDWVFRNNIYKHVGGTFFTYVPGTRFYNNVFYESGHSTGAALLFRASRDRNTAHNSGCWNNIFVRCGSYSNSSWSVETGVTNFVALSNTVQTLEGGTDPLFVNPLAGTPEGFQLQSGSPCLGRAYPFNELFTKDFAGVMRGDEWDIGAFDRPPAISMEPMRPPAPVLRVIR